MPNFLDKNASDKLYQELKRIRFRIAQENGLPAWKIFNDKQREEYVKLHPRDKGTFLKISFPILIDLVFLVKNFVRLYQIL